MQETVIVKAKSPRFPVDFPLVARFPLGAGEFTFTAWCNGRCRSRRPYHFGRGVHVAFLPQPTRTKAGFTDSAESLVLA